MKQIIAMGGGGFSMEPDNLLLDRYVLAQVPKEMPKVCFVPTASGDSYQNLILRGQIQSGYAADDGAALHFINGQLHGVVSSREKARAYGVECEGITVKEKELQAKYLGR